MLFKINFFFKIVLFKKLFWFKTWRVVKTLIHNLTNFRTFSPRSDFYLVFQVRTEWWYLLSTLIPTYFKEENWKTMCVIVSRQMNNWKLPHVNSSLNMWGIPFWQHTFFTEVTDRTLWSINCNISAVFLQNTPLWKQEKRSSVRILSIFSNVFVWATRRRVMEKNCYLHSIYPILNAGRNLPKSWNFSKLKVLNRKSNFKTFDAQNISKMVA